ncbi:5-methylcytosine-specific restriction enzyme subunit McrC [compost metagenome]
MAELCLREFGLLVQGARNANSMDVCGVASAEAWNFFESLAFSDANEDRFMDVARFEGRKALRVKNFVGVISSPDGTQLEILPKTSDERPDVEGTRALLWKMLGAVNDLPFLETTDAQLKLRQGPLVEALVAIFLEQVATVVRRGIRRDYKRIEAEERFLRGRLRVAQQMQAPPGRQHLFQIEYDIFSENRAENRLLQAALAKVARTSKTDHNQRLARELGHGLELVPLSADYRLDFANWRTGRDMVHYQPLLPWLRLILNQECPHSLKDNHAGISFLFPMEKLFEKYVELSLRRCLAPHRIIVQGQAQSRYLAHEPRAFLLKPDIMLCRAQAIIGIADAKWKLIDEHTTYGSGDKDPKAGIKQADMYQLFAYGHKYLGGKGRLVLIYPKWRGFTKPLTFDLGGGLVLDVVPFDLASGTCDMIDQFELLL